MFVKLSTCNTQRDDEDIQTQIYRCISLIVTTVHCLCHSHQQKKGWEIQLTSDDIKSPREIAHEDKETARIIAYLLQIMGFASARKLRLTAITGGIWFTLLLATGIQGKLATQTPSKHPGHKPELSLLHANGWMWA